MTGEALRPLLAGLPNIPAPGVPVGADEAENVERGRWGEPFAIADAKDHVDLGAALGLMDFEAAARMSGARFVVLTGELARLERALGQFMLDIQTREHGYTEVSPPLLVRDEAVFGAGQLPKFAEDLFRTTDDRWLIPTAEVSLTNLVREQITRLRKRCRCGLDGADRTASRLRGRRLGQGHARHDPPAPVL